MTSRLRISSIDVKLLNQQVTLNGWVRTRRGSKGISFIQLYDGSNQNGIQAVADELLVNYEEISRLTTGTSVSIIGKVVESPAKGQTFEINAEEVRVIGASSGDLYPL
ncbi:MAG: asparagine--tRNA ligase, partial [Proteobacteria bacterium]|nr:asparagine--tRNA ligase [Pseudomonadota bacterium]